MIGATLVALTVGAAPGPETPPQILPEPVCMESMIAVALYLFEGWGEIASIYEERAGGRIVMFADPTDRSWSLVTDSGADFCITAQSEAGL